MTYASTFAISGLFIVVAYVRAARAIEWSSPKYGDVVSSGDMVLAVWNAPQINSPILRLCSQGAGDCSELPNSNVSHRKDGSLAFLLTVPHIDHLVKPFFQVEHDGKVYDSPQFTVIEPIQGERATPAAVTPVSEDQPVAEVSAPTPSDTVTQTIIVTAPNNSEDSHSLALNAKSLESSWLPRLPAKPAVLMDTKGPNIVGLVVAILVVCFALAAIGALIAIVRVRRKRNRRLDAMLYPDRRPEMARARTEDRLTRVPVKKPNAAPTVQYLPNLHSLRVYTVSEETNSEDARARTSLEDVQLTPRHSFPSVGGSAKDGRLNGGTSGISSWASVPYLSTTSRTTASRR